MPLRLRPGMTFDVGDSRGRYTLLRISKTAKTLWEHDRPDICHGSFSSATILGHRLVSEPPETLADKLDAIIETAIEALVIAGDVSPNAVGPRVADALASLCLARMALTVPGDDHATAERLGADLLGIR